jgi:hypothetical protein
MKPATQAIWMVPRNRAIGGPPNAYDLAQLELWRPVFFMMPSAFFVVMVVRAKH